MCLPEEKGGTIFEKMKKDTLQKFLNDQCTPEELEEVLQWVRKESLSPGSREWGFENWKSYDTGSPSSGDERFGPLLDKIHHKIHLSHPEVYQKPAVRKLSTWLVRAAAILLIPVLGLLIYTWSRSPAITAGMSQLSVDSLEIVAPIGSKTRIQLSDGSEVFLNHGSKLQYPRFFSEESRTVYLTGEAYFQVVHQPERPFIVKTRNWNVKALGTAFNVFAYSGEPVVSTTLVEGKVVVEKKGPDDQFETVGSMQPGQHVSYNPVSGEIFSTREDIEKYISWKDGKLVFKNESIVQIARRLSRWYNVDIDFADEAAKEYTYTATFMDETLWQILDLLKIATPIDWRKVPREKSPDGTFSRQRIIIEKKK